MDAATAQRFKAGAGIEPAALHDLAVSLAGLAAILWAAWAVHGLYRQWRAETLDLLGLVAGMLRTTVIAVMILWFLQ